MKVFQDCSVEINARYTVFTSGNHTVTDTCKLEQVQSQRAGLKTTMWGIDGEAANM